ncbi:flp/fap pilin protein [Prescottella equi]|uniref:Flp family type IVb pilin n=1 Tax=Rhodococcus hoagii TaxID=43767 RepID=UPI00042D28A5|nr:Flp family type IVb pilin [Prescottella equi]MBM4695318.1 Flp family type IVb pilin [Prescottella equi]NKR58211.1 Flp family type IVb pilin [Prescottella equi]NKR69855.1 Flp family type IVb pilin [Prescottella equi]NKR91753.1 Flp family type IVb pilin [Prescottella equi]NKS31244.1 Flp family type IVb pilin [Prescottella equi]
MNLFFANLYLMGLDVKDRLTRDDRGATAVEYGLMVAGIAMVILIAVFAFGGKISELFSGFNFDKPAASGT